MEDCSRLLADAVKSARRDLGYTQEILAERAGVGDRTIINIEGGKRDTLFSSVFAVIRALGIDPAPVFFPEKQEDCPYLERLRILIDSCDEQEAKDMLEIIPGILKVLRSKKGTDLSELS